MKKILLSAIMLTMLLSGCSMAYAGTDTAMQDEKITADFISISGHENLYYNKDTKVVYWIGGSYSANVMGNDYTTSYMTAYFAPNGKPYIYDESLGSIKEIEGDSNE